MFSSCDPIYFTASLLLFFFFSGPKDVFEMVRKILLCSELLPDLHCSILSEPFEDDFCKPVT